ncbi:MAG: HAMP domain-containing histidine kinase [Clostridia bacterium]|nr:HAMP domain-containing histidine kinase [Clostridia bacterium]
MMKKKHKKKQNYGRVKITLFSGLALLFILLLTLGIATLIYFILSKYGIVDKFNYKTVMVIDYAGVCTVIGFILSIIVVHRPAAKMQKLLDAMEQIANGDFSVRLRKQKKHEKFTNRTVDMFNNMAQQLGSTEMLSNDFISNFSHEFKTPIASINGFAKLLKDENLSDEEKNEYLDIILQESERLSNLSINILSLSKLEQQTILTNKTEFNLSEQIRIIIGSLYTKWSAKNLDIVFEGEDIFINANKEMLGQVWINLLDNAIKFSPENKEVIFSITRDENNVYISLRNYGKTVSDDQLNRIFDKFYQGDESHFTSGNGLGLPMVKRIIELHNGKINVTNKNNSIIVFDLELPIY